MPATVIVNMLTVVHKDSGGVVMIFPDVCKTPAPPAPPIPIPYPNIAKSQDTADGSSSVKMDGNPIMLKSSNFMMSTGDEAGSAMGVVSNKIKGKAFRIGHIGHFNDLMLMGTLSGVEMGLELSNIPHRKGGVLAAMEVLTKSASQPASRPKARSTSQ